MADPETSDRDVGLRTSHRRLRVAALVLLGLALTLFAIRGPLRALTSGNHDFQMLFAAARATAHGESPYRFRTLESHALAAGVPPAPRSARTFHALYPPSTYVVLAPLARLPWRVAGPVWTALGLVSTLLVIALSIRCAGLPRSGPLVFSFVAFALAFAPVHTALDAGQPSIAVTALGLLALRGSGLGHPARAGFWLAVALALKPQLALPFVIYLPATRRWLPCALGLAGAVLLAALGALLLADTSWVSDLRANLASWRIVGPGSPTPANPLRYQLLNLQVLLLGAIADRGLADLLAASLTGCAALAAVGLALRLPRAESRAGHELLPLLGALAALSLLAVSHRSYDAVILLPGVAASFARLAGPGPGRGPALATLLGSAAFLAPGSALLVHLETRGALPAGLLESPLGTWLLLPHQTWALLLVAAATLAALRPSATGAETEAESSSAP